MTDKSMANSDDRTNQHIIHVTRTSYRESILTEGFRPAPFDSASPRDSLSEAADHIGTARYEAWPQRVGGVYFWETIDQARKKTSALFDDPLVAFEVDPHAIDSPLWQFPSDDWERLRSEWPVCELFGPEGLYRRDETESAQTQQRPPFDRSSAVWAALESLVERAHPDDRTRTGDAELWTAGPVSPAAIVDVRPFDSS